MNERGLVAGAEGLEVTRVSENLEEETAGLPFSFVWPSGEGTRWQVFVDGSSIYANPVARDGARLFSATILSEGEEGELDGVALAKRLGISAADSGECQVVKVGRIDSATLEAWASQNLPSGDELAQGEEDGRRVAPEPGQEGSARAPDDEEGGDDVR